jgi:hypothetical protein
LFFEKLFCSFFFCFKEKLGKAAKERKPEAKKDVGKRKAKGLAHRRNAGEDSVARMSAAVLRETSASFCVDMQKEEERRPCFVQLKGNQLCIFEHSKTSGVMELVCCASLQKDLRVDELEEGLTLEYVRGVTDEKQTEAVPSFAAKTVSLFFSSSSLKTEWLGALRQFTIAASRAALQQEDEEEEPPVAVAAESYEFESDNFTTRKADVPFEKLSALPNASASFLNRILWRLFQEMATIALFEEKLGERVMVQLKKKVAKAREMGKWPVFLEDIRYGGIIKVTQKENKKKRKTDSCVKQGERVLEGASSEGGQGGGGRHFARTGRCRSQPKQTNKKRGVLIVCCFQYSGGAGVRLFTRVLLPGVLGRVFGGCPVEIVVRLVRIRAIVFVLMPRNFDEKVKERRKEKVSFVALIVVLAVVFSCV